MAISTAQYNALVDRVKNLETWKAALVADMAKANLVARVTKLEGGVVVPPPPVVDPPPVVVPPPSTGFDPLTLNTTTTGAFGPVLLASGGITTSADGQVIEKLDVSGRITVQHRNVTIRNCKVANSEYYAIFAPDDAGHDVSGLTVDHCTISGAINGIAGKGTFTRNNISKVDNGINVWGPSTISENYIHDLGSVMSAGTGHNDGIENNGSGMTLLRNRIEASNSADTSAVMTNNEFGKLNNVLIDGNYLAGGQYTLYVDSSKSSANMPVSNFVVTNNTLKKGNYGWTALYNSGVVVGPSNKLV